MALKGWGNGDDAHPPTHNNNNDYVDTDFEVKKAGRMIFNWSRNLFVKV